MSTIKSLKIYVQHRIDDDVAALNNVRDRLAKAIDRLDGNDTATLIKLGSDISRVVSAIDWRRRQLENNSRHISTICEEEKESSCE